MTLLIYFDVSESDPQRPLNFVDLDALTCVPSRVLTEGMSVGVNDGPDWFDRRLFQTLDPVRNYE